MSSPLISPEYAALLASIPDQRKPWRCCKAPGPQGYLCTERAVRQADGSYMHTGDHVAEGRAEGEPDSVVASWPQERRCICPDPLEGRNDLACTIHGRAAFFDSDF